MGENNGLHFADRYGGLTVQAYMKQLKQAEDAGVRLFEKVFRDGGQGTSIGKIGYRIAELIFHPLFFLSGCELKNRTLDYAKEEDALFTRSRQNQYFSNGNRLLRGLGINIDDNTFTTNLKDSVKGGWSLGSFERVAAERGFDRDAKLTEVLQWIYDEYIDENSGAKCKEAFAAAVNHIFGEEAYNRMENATQRTARAMLEKAIAAGAKQLVLTGAPGTGKTHAIEEYVDTEKPAGFTLVQFHASYDYADFVEGLRPVMVEADGKKEMTFCRLDGIFKKFCRDAVGELLDALKEGDPETAFAWYRAYAGEETREKVPKDKRDAIAAWLGRRYVFAIDEINRADLSRVFGELMRSLEEGYRGPGKSAPTQYKNLPTYKIDRDTKIAEPIPFDCFADGFFIPENVLVFGTMNDIDRSVETFDFALRRRFLWIEVKADEVMESTLRAILKDAPTLPALLERITEMNRVIAEAEGLGESYQIGPAYFKTYDGTNLETIWQTRIEPLLREYYRGRPKEKTERFLGACRKGLLDGKKKP